MSYAVKRAAEGKSLPGKMRILDMADEKGTFCSKLLADMGAEVIKIEKPGGDSSRYIGPFLNNVPHPERSLSFFYHNTNKRGITLNVEKSAGREIFCRLLKGADIVIETFPPGYLAEIALDFAALREINPRLILVSITGFGQTGPRRHFKSCDLVASAMSGQMYISGAPSTPPLKPFGEQSYYTASLFAAIGILLAIRKRNQTGEGDHVDISLQEALTSTLDHVLVRYFHDRVLPQRQGALYWNNEFFIVPTKDGFILLTLFQQWETLVGWMDGEGMAADLTDKKWNDEEYRRNHRDHIITVVQRWASTHTTGELCELGQMLRFPWAPVHPAKETAESPQLKARGFFTRIDHPEINASLTYPGLPFRFTPSREKSWKCAPVIGEHNSEIFQGELGLTSQELTHLAQEGTI